MQRRWNRRCRRGAGSRAWSETEAKGHDRGRRKDVWCGREGPRLIVASRSLHKGLRAAPGLRRHASPSLSLSLPPSLSLSPHIKPGRALCLLSLLHSIRLRWRCCGRRGSGDRWAAASFGGRARQGSHQWYLFRRRLCLGMRMHSRGAREPRRSLRLVCGCEWPVARGAGVGAVLVTRVAKWHCVRHTLDPRPYGQWCARTGGQGLLPHVTVHRT